MPGFVSTALVEVSSLPQPSPVYFPDIFASPRINQRDRGIHPFCWSCPFINVHLAQPITSPCLSAALRPYLEQSARTVPISNRPILALGVWPVCCCVVPLHFSLHSSQRWAPLLRRASRGSRPAIRVWCIPMRSIFQTTKSIKEIRQGNWITSASAWFTMLLPALPQMAAFW